MELSIESVSDLNLYTARRSSGNQETIFEAISFDVPIKSFYGEKKVSVIFLIKKFAKCKFSGSLLNYKSLPSKSRIARKIHSIINCGSIMRSFE